MPGFAYLCRTRKGKKYLAVQAGAGTLFYAIKRNPTSTFTDSGKLKISSIFKLWEVDNVKSIQDNGE